MALIPAPEYAALKEAFADAFTTTSDLEGVVRQAREMALQHVAMGDDLLEIIGRVLLKAETEGWMGRLLEAACTLRPLHEGLKAQRRRWQARGYPLGAVGAPVNPYKALLLPGRRVLIDREKLRTCLAGLADEQGVQGARVLVVDGDNESGKSYSLQVVGFLAETLDNFRFAAIDMERVPRNGNNKVPATELARSISRALVPNGKHYEPSTPPDGNYTTWSDDYCHWLREQLPAGSRRWLVIDSFSKVGVEQEAYDLIAMLAMRTYLELPDLRLVLLNYGDVSWLSARVAGGVDSEKIEPIGIVQLRAYFGQLLIELRKHQGQPLSPADQPAFEAAKKQVRELADRVQQRAAAATGRRLEALGRLTWEEVEQLLRPAAAPDDTQLLLDQLLDEGPDTAAAAPPAPPPGGP